MTLPLLPTSACPPHPAHLVEQHQVRVRDLQLRLVRPAAWPRLRQLPPDVDGIDDCHDGVQAHGRLHLLVSPQRCRNGPRVGQACGRGWREGSGRLGWAGLGWAGCWAGCWDKVTSHEYAGQPTRGLDEHIVELVPLEHQGLQRRHKVAFDAAAEAAVCQLHPLLDSRLPALQAQHDTPLSSSLGWWVCCAASTSRCHHSRLGPSSRCRGALPLVPLGAGIAVCLAPELAAGAGLAAGTWGRTALTSWSCTNALSMPISSPNSLRMTAIL
jgi:hypothetical protein